jgi:hypothetical protein
MIFESIFTISGKAFLNPFSKQPAKMLGSPGTAYGD